MSKNKLKIIKDFNEPELEILNLAKQAIRSVSALWAGAAWLMPVKYPPIPSFWASWSVAVVSVILMALMLSSHRHNFSRGWLLPVASLPFVALVALLLLQQLVHRQNHPAAIVIPMAALVLAFGLCVVGARAEGQQALKYLIQGWAVGLLTALAVNCSVAILEQAGVRLLSDGWARMPRPARAEALVRQPNQLAVMAVLAWNGAFYLSLVGKLGGGVAFLSCILSSFLVASTGSRAGLVCLIAACALAFVCGSRTLSQNTVSSLYLRRTAVAIVVTQLFWVVIQPVLPEASGGQSQTVVRGEYSARLELIRDSFEIWKQNPLLGVGIGHFSAARVEQLRTPMLEPNASNPHNILMELLVEWGLVGFVVAVVPLTFILRSVVRERGRLTHEAIFALLVVSVILLYSLLEYPLGYLYFLFPFALALGMLVQPALQFTVGRRHAVTFMLLGMVGVFIAVVAIVDYLPLQRSYTEVAQRLRRGDQVVVNASDELANKVAGATLYPKQSAYLFARTMEPDGSYMEFKLNISREAMKVLPNGETIARYLAFCILLDLEDEAEEALRDAARNPLMWNETMSILGLYAQQRSGVQDFMERKGLLQASR